MILKSTPVLIAASLLIGIAVGWRIEAWRANATHNALLAQMQAASQRAEQQQRRIEQQRADDIEVIRVYANDQIEKARADADAASAVADSMREQARRVAARACKDSSPAAGSKTAEPAAVLLAELFERADARAGELAAAYDRARVAGMACQEAYDALRGES